MNEIFEYFKNKKNLTNLLILAIVALSLPLVTASIRYQKILFSRAAGEPIVFSGPNVTTVNNQKVLKLNDQGRAIVDLDLTSSLGPPAGAANQQQVNSYQIQMANTQNNSSEVNMSFIPNGLVKTVYAQTPSNCSIDPSDNQCWGTVPGNCEDDPYYYAGDGLCWSLCSANACGGSSGGGTGGTGGTGGNGGTSSCTLTHCQYQGGDAYCNQGYSGQPYKCAPLNQCPQYEDGCYDNPNPPQEQSWCAQNGGNIYCNENGKYPNGTYICDLDTNDTQYGDGCYDGNLDSDNDGVVVPDDQCPTQQGTADNNGCPGSGGTFECSDNLSLRDCEGQRSSTGKWYCLNANTPWECTPNAQPTTDDWLDSFCWETREDYERWFDNPDQYPPIDQCPDNPNAQCTASVAFAEGSCANGQPAISITNTNIASDDNQCLVHVTAPDGRVSEFQIECSGANRIIDNLGTDEAGNFIRLMNGNYSVSVSGNSSICQTPTPVGNVAISCSNNTQNTCELAINDKPYIAENAPSDPVNTDEGSEVTFRIKASSPISKAVWLGTNQAGIEGVPTTCDANNNCAPNLEALKLDTTLPYSTTYVMPKAGTYTRQANVTFENGTTCKTGTYTINVAATGQSKPTITNIEKLGAANDKTHRYAPSSSQQFKVSYANGQHYDTYYFGPFPDDHDPKTLTPATAPHPIGSPKAQSTTITWNVPRETGKYYYVANAHSNSVAQEISDWLYPQNIGCAWDKKVYKQIQSCSKETDPNCQVQLAVVQVNNTDLECSNFGPVEFWVGPAGGPGATATPTAPGQRTNPPGGATNPPGQRTNPPGGATNPPGQRTNPPGGATNPPGGATNPPGQRTNPPGATNPPGGVRTVSFKVADDPVKLATAAAQPYVNEPTRITFPFSDSRPGLKTIFVEFLANTGATKREQASITVLGPDPEMTGCSLNIDDKSVTFNIVGKNFGEAGTIKSGQNNLTVVEWKAGSIKATLSNAQSGQNFPISITNKAGQSTSGACSSISPLAFGAKLFCRQPQKLNQDNVKIGLVGPIPGGKFNQETVTIDKDGIVQGLKSKLEAGKKYRLSIEAPKSLRRSVEFTAAEGTTNLSNFILPIGDIFPLSVGDGAINVPDKSELNREWIIASDAKDRPGDFNQDARVNSIDWACMRYDFGKVDDAEVSANN